MINNFKRGEYVTKTAYELQFYVDNYGGFAFPCDSEGNILADEMTQAAIDNYNWCMDPANRDKFKGCFNYVHETFHSWREPNTGTCHCGNEMVLVSEYLGACECPNCGRWYNIFGQELNNPDTWSQGDDW